MVVSISHGEPPVSPCFSRWMRHQRQAGGGGSRPRCSICREACPAKRLEQMGRFSWGNHGYHSNFEVFQYMSFSVVRSSSSWGWDGCEPKSCSTLHGWFNHCWKCFFVGPSFGIPLRPFAWVLISRYLGQEVRPGLSSFVLVAQCVRHNEVGTCVATFPSRFHYASDFGGQLIRRHSIDHHKIS